MYLGTVVDREVVPRLWPVGRPSRPPPSEAIIVDPAMKRLYELAHVIAPSDINVLILGETGTGKELYAEAIHARSARAAGPFVRVNSASLAGSLLDSELFGHERGAFTGATQTTEGLIASADGGTLFLDEIGELPLETQAKLLRAVERGEVMRLGSVRPRRVDVRFVAATHRNLERAVSQERFRADLLFRLNGFTVTLPPLRQRSSEVLPIAEALLAAAAARLGARVPELHPDAQAALLGHAWPGNIRELKNVVERAVTLCRGGRVVSLEHLMLGPPWTGSAWRTTRRATDPEAIVLALQRTGSQERAAAELGISRRTLIHRLEELGIPRPRKG